MESEAGNAAPYTLRVEGSVVPLSDRDFITTVLARSTEGEMENSLVLLTPEQVHKLHEFLRVQDVTPAIDGIYVGNTGVWHVVKQGAVVQTGQWRIPDDVLTSLQGARPSAATASAVSAKAYAGPGERDPVCGIIITPGLEAANVVYKEHTYHFCSAECREIFRENPARYAQSLVGAG
jgi:YHS domain-containing protein